ncbi:DUF2141 domain-containing protein [Winogradskyella maritima]|uniref:DUF2141 domain-containing protein n=1 Tax=Winogradskyella maritima TaxID=1517766 RepID=A0ABV8AJA3_9FLAO|nr:DUF2141 domain-containing protein [Winogradskyella maritima]
MKNLILTIALVVSSLMGFAQDTRTITVTVDNVVSNEGKVSFALHTKDTFMKAAPVATAESKIEDGKVSITFEDVAPGEYAIIALHDANENDKMDFQPNGMPKENYGTSNNVMSFGPPQYDDAKFIISDKDLDLKIRF